MLKRFYPTHYLNSIYEIDFDNLQNEGITTLLFDLDNTVAPFDIIEPTDEVISFFDKLVKMDFKICLVSNNKAYRVTKYNEKLGLKTLPKAGKPKLKGIKKAVELCGGDITKAVMIGDQVFTDVWVGNRLKMQTILVKPIADRDEFTVKLKRGLERLVINTYNKSI